MERNESRVLFEED